MLEWAGWSVILLVVNFCLATAVTVHAVMWKRDSRSVIGWVGLAWLAPLVGGAAYLLLGINRIHRKATTLKLRQIWGYDPEPKVSPNAWKQAERALHEQPHLLGLVSAGGKLSGLHLKPGNSIEPLINGDETYPAMLAAIRAAQRSVSLLSYIFDSDRIGEQFLTALLDAQQRGVEVRVLVDDVGSKYSHPNMVTRMQRDGLAAARFLHTRLPRLPKYANMRNHRKIMVVDGQIGFTGGTNIREDHCLNLNPRYPAQCLHFEIRGPVVRQLQRVFAIDWSFATGEELSGPTWFPEIANAGDIWARGIEHGPDEQFERLNDLIAAALTTAEHCVRIVTPYFLPHSALIQALNAAALQDVRVEILIPENNNIRLVQWACNAQLWQNLEKGCQVFRTPDPFDHSKLMVVDDSWSLIGSTNWDPRSLRLNFEFNVECYSRQFAAQLNRIIDGKRAVASEVTLEELDARPLAIRLRDGLARLATPYL